MTAATRDRAPAVSLRRTVPGSGNILRWVLRDAIPDMPRFPRLQAVGADCRVVKGAQASAGTRDGGAGTQLGHADRTGACSAAAGRCLRKTPAGQQWLARWAKPPGQGNAWTVWAHQLARAGADLLNRGTAFALAPLLQQSWSGAGAPDASRDGARISLATALCAARRPGTPLSA